MQPFAVNAEAVINSEVKKIEDKSSVSCLVSKDEKIVILPSAVVSFECEYKFGKCRILLDSYSQVTLFSDEFVPVNAAHNAPRIKGVRVGASTIPVKATTKLKICSRSTKFTLEIEGDIVPVAAIPYVIDIQPSAKTNNTLGSFKLADPAFASSRIQISHIDILVGAEYYKHCMLNE